MTGGVAPGRIAVDWIAVDWGTSHLRAWAMDGDGAVLAEAESGAGMGALDPAAFEGALLTLAGDWLPAGRRTPVVACGMVGARQGWVDAGYRAVPCTPLGGGTVTARAADPRLAVSVVPGLKQTSPADVMRGEETQIAGFLEGRPGFDGVLCLPGTHTKWARISAGEVVSFQSFVTGELFAAIARHSVLRHTVGGEGWDAGAFREALDTALAKPEALAGRLFSLRAEALLDGLDPGAARARLSGLLIGIELAAARPYWLGEQIVLLGDAALAGPYAAAITAQGAPPERAEAAAMTRAGLTRAREMAAEAGA